MIDKFLSVLGSVVVVAGVTAATLPGRQTPALTREGFTGFATVLKAATGR